MFSGNIGKIYITQYIYAYLVKRHLLIAVLLLVDKKNSVGSTCANFTLDIADVKCQKVNVTREKKYTKIRTKSQK